MKKVFKNIFRIYKDLISKQCDNRLVMMDRAMELIKSVFHSGIAYKTKHYASEKETRLIYRYNDEPKELPVGWKIKDLQTYVKRNLINTYVPLEFPKDIIKKVVVGPKYQNNYFKTELALEVLGYTGVTIEQSTSGYR